MSSPATTDRSSYTRPFQLLLAPAGQLSGDGQLRELMLERRSRTTHRSRAGSAGSSSSIWFLSPAHVQQLGLGGDEQNDEHDGALAAQEALVTEDPAVHVWLQLRFGGRSASVAELSQLPHRLERSWLEQQASGLPPAAPQPPVALAGALA